MVHLGTIYESQEFPAGGPILPDRCPEKHEDSLGHRPASEVPSEERVAETAYDTSQEAPEVHPEEEAPEAEEEAPGVGPEEEAPEVRPEEEAPEVHPDEKAAEVDVGPEVRKAVHERMMKMDEVEFAKAMKAAQQHPRFCDFLMSVPFDKANTEVEFLVLWELWCKYFGVAAEAPSVQVLTAAEQRALRKAKTEKGKKGGATSKAKKAKGAKEGKRRQEGKRFKEGKRLKEDQEVETCNEGKQGEACKGRPWRKGACRARAGGRGPKEKAPPIDLLEWPGDLQKETWLRMIATCFSFFFKVNMMVRVCFSISFLRPYTNISYVYNI